MNDPAQRRLNDPLKSSLKALATTPCGADEFASSLDDIMMELGKLPAHAVVWAERQIAFAGSLEGAPQRPKRLLGVFEREPAEQRKLREHPKLAYIWQFHRNGYVREMALRAITVPPVNGFFLAALFSRLNDWAEPVRLEAERCIRRVLPGVTAALAVAASPYLLGRPTDWQRWSPAGRALLDELMHRPDVVLALVARFKAGADGPLASQLRSLLRSDVFDHHLPMLAAESRNPGVRTLCLKTLLSGHAELPDGFETKWIDKVYGLSKSVRKFKQRPVLADVNIAGLVADCVMDPLTAVRRVAADTLIRDHGSFPLLENHVELLLQDKNASVRERADYLRRQLQKQTPARRPGLQHS